MCKLMVYSMNKRSYEEVVVISNELDIVLEMWMQTALPRFDKTRNTISYPAHQRMPSIT